MPKKRGHGDGGLYYSKTKKLWRGVVDMGTDPVTGKRIQKEVTSRSQKTANDKLKALRAEIEEHGAPLDKKTTVAAWSQVWLRDHVEPTVDPSTYAGYKSYVKKWIVPTLGQRPIAGLKPSDVSAVHNAVRAAGLKSATLRRIHVALSLMLDQARREGLCSRNVAKDVKLGKVIRGERGSLSPHAAGAILEAALDDELASYWWFKLLMGPRQGESLGARLEDLDLVAGSYLVRWKLEQLTKKHGCGDERADGTWPCGKIRGSACPDSQWRIPHDFEMRHIQGRWALTRPKSKTGRYVPLLDQVTVMIAEYLRDHPDQDNPHGLIWRDANGLPFASKDEAQWWRNLLHKAGQISAEQTLPGKSPIDGHWARHTTVTVLMALCGDAQLVGEIVGHSSSEVTEIYRHADPKEKHALVARLGSQVPGGSPAAIEA